MHSEIESLYEEAGLAGISVVEDEIFWLSEIGSHLRSEAIKAVEKGMDEMNQNDIWCGLQVLYNLGELRSTVDALINKYKGIGVRTVGSALDMKAISATAEAGGGGFGAAMDNNASAYMDEYQKSTMSLSDRVLVETAAISHSFSA